jgi:general secretion pathway protein L
VIANIAGHLLVRENKYAGQSIDDLSLYLDYQTLAEDKKVKVSHLNNAQLQSLNAVVTQDRVESFQYVIPTLKKSQTHPWNILPKAKNASGVSGYWKACVAVLCAFIFVQIGYDAIRWYQNKKVADLTAVQAVDQFKSWFGQSYPVTEQTLKSQFEAQLRLNQTGNTQALQLLSRVGPLLMQHQVVANRVSYEASVLNMELKASSAQVLQQLTEQLNQQGFKVELGNIQPKDNGAVGQVKIQ